MNSDHKNFNKKLGTIKMQGIDPLWDLNWRLNDREPFRKKGGLRGVILRIMI